MQLKIYNNNTTIVINPLYIHYVMVQNEWNIYYWNCSINHLIYINKTMNVFNTFFLCLQTTLAL